LDIDFKNQQINVQIHVVEIFVQSREGVWLADDEPLEPPPNSNDDPPELGQENLESV